MKKNTDNRKQRERQKRSDSNRHYTISKEKTRSK